MPDTELAGLYLHIPFCHSKCTYCSFITGSYEDQLSQRYLKALNQEVRALAARLKPNERQIDTIYFGGGTPSIIPTTSLAELLSTCRQSFDLASNCEITAEMNPSDLDPARLSDYRAMGINRVSIGIQSFIDSQLQALGRDHSVQDARTGFERLRAAGFDNISLDLIAGLPDQTRDEWQYNLDCALKLSPEHLSIYLLEIKEGTTMYAQIRSGRLRTPDEDLAADMYEMMLDATAAHGYQHYEISNFAKADAQRSLRSRHNIKYWLDIPYYGVGVSAHSYFHNERYWNVKSTHTYIEQIITTDQAIEDRSCLNEHDRAREAFMLQLRLIEGVDLTQFNARHNFDVKAEYQQELSELSEAGLLEITDDRVRLTRRGILLSNEVFLLFV